MPKDDSNPFADPRREVRQRARLASAGVTKPTTGLSAAANAQHTSAVNKVRALLGVVVPPAKDDE